MPVLLISIAIKKYLNEKKEKDKKKRKKFNAEGFTCVNMRAPLQCEMRLFPIIEYIEY